MSTSELMRFVHNGANNPYRMSAIVRRDQRDAWLNGTTDEARAFLGKYAECLMVA